MITLNQDNYITMHTSLIKSEEINNLIITYLLDNTELTSDTKNLKLGYNIISSDFLVELLKRSYPKEFKAQLLKLQEKLNQDMEEN